MERSKELCVWGNTIIFPGQQSTSEYGPVKLEIMVAF